jgi:pseudouridine kinase
MDGVKQQLLALLHEDPFTSQQALAERLGVSRSAVAGHLAALTREGHILGRAYVLPQRPALICIGGANIDRKLRTLGALCMGTSNPASQRETPGGVARNVAENLARLGLPAQLISAVGDDAAGRALLAGAAEAGLSTQGTLVAAGEVTGSYTAVLDDAGAMVLALAAMPLAERLTPDFLRRSSAQRQQARLIVLDLNLPADSLALLLQEARNTAALVIAVAVSEPKMRRLPEDLRGLHGLILNRGELRAAATGTEDAALASLHQRGVRQVIVTDGGAGLICSEAGSPPQRLTPPATPVVDVTGAGDAFAAGVCAALYQNPAQDLVTACQLGLQLAALTLQTEATVHPDVSPCWLARHLESTNP